jgi:hypothetical protein
VKLYKPEEEQDKVNKYSRPLLQHTREREKCVCGVLRFLLHQRSPIKRA